MKVDIWQSGEYPLFDAVSPFWKTWLRLCLKMEKVCTGKTQGNSLRYWPSGKKVNKARAKRTGAKGSWAIGFAAVPVLVKVQKKRNWPRVQVDPRYHWIQMVHEDPEHQILQAVLHGPEYHYIPGPTLTSPLEPLTPGGPLTLVLPVVFFTYSLKKKKQQQQ